MKQKIKPQQFKTKMDYITYRITGKTPDYLNDETEDKKAELIFYKKNSTKNTMEQTSTKLQKNTRKNTTSKSSEQTEKEESKDSKTATSDSTEEKEATG